MKIGIDARFYGPAGKGLGRYTQKLIENLEKIDFKNQYFIFLRKDNFSQYEPRNTNFRKIMADFPWYSFSEQIKMPWLLNKFKLDLVHFPHFNVPIFYRKKFVVTIHDLILLHFPTIKSTTLNPIFYWFKFFAYRIVIKHAVFRSKKIIAVSEFTKNDIYKNYNVDPEKISVTYEACDIFLEKNEIGAIEKYGIIKPYLLYVGNAYPHKNLEKLILAFKKITDTEADLSLVLVGKEDYFYNRLKKFAKTNFAKNIKFIGPVSDAELKNIYINSVLYVFPSLYEGFGLPALEALSLDIPVAVSDHPCMREVLGEAAIFFDGKSPKDIGDIILSLLKSPEIRKKIIREGRILVKKYDWKKMASETLEIYEKEK